MVDDHSQHPFLYLTTSGWRSGQAHEIEIWFTISQGRFYLISERGEQAHWVQNIRRNSDLVFRVGEQEFTGQGRVVERALEPVLHARICALSELKYGWGDGLVVELEPKYQE